MKIGLIKPYATGFLYYGGIQAQARMWKRCLEELGNEVVMMNGWDDEDWNSYDFILFMGYGKTLSDYVEEIKAKFNTKMVCAPIIDYNKGIKRFKFICRHLGSKRLKLTRPEYDLHLCQKDICLFLARSEFEKRYIHEGLGVDEDRIKIVPISYSLEENPVVDFSKKENFCMHVSRLATPGKNVGRLIEASIKYNFKLVLCGALNGEEENNWLKNQITGHENIKYVGRLSDEDMFDYYRRAKVFALPSFIEGVGIVALEAGLFGDEIVLTKNGAPKEYYDGMARLVDPYSVDEIGKAVLASFESGFQPALKAHIEKHYSPQACGKLLNDYLKERL